MTTIISNPTVTNHQIARKVAAQTNEVGKLSTQIANEKKYNTYSEVEANKIIVLSELEHSILSLETQNKNNLLLGEKLEQYSAQMFAMQQLLTNTIQLTKQIANPVMRPSLDVEMLVTHKVLELKSYLNIQFNGQYLFSGSKTNIPAIGDIENISNIANDGSISVNYYQGNDFIQMQKISDEVTLAYGETAANPTYAKFFAALHHLKASANTNDVTQINLANDLLQEVKMELAQRLSVIGNCIQQVETQVEFSKSLIESSKKYYSDIITVDIALATSQFHDKIAKLQALYKVNNLLRETSYINYMK